MYLKFLTQRILIKQNANNPSTYLEQHRLNKTNDNKSRNTANSILQHFPITNANGTTPHQSPLNPSTTYNRPDTFILTKTQQTIQQPSNTRHSTNTSTPIKKIAPATKLKLKQIKEKI